MYDNYFGLAKFILLQGMQDYARARFVFYLSAEMFNWNDIGLSSPEEIARGIGASNVWSGEKRGVTALKSYLSVANSFARDFLPSIAERDTRLGKSFHAHLERTKEETIKASSLVMEQGTAVFFGAGILAVVPLAEMLRERLPDGRLKYEKIILIELAENYSEPALQGLIDNGAITEEEAERVEIIVNDVTNALDKMTGAIDEIMLKAINTDGEPEIPTEELYEFIKGLYDLRKVFSYTVPIAERTFKDESVNLVVFALSLEDFTESIIRYIMMWLEAYPQWLKGMDEVNETWERCYDFIEYCLAIVTLDEAVRILAPEGILFFAGFIGQEKIVSDKKEKNIFKKSETLRRVIHKAFGHGGPNYRMQEVDSASWRRPDFTNNLNERVGHSSIVGALTLKKVHKSQGLPTTSFHESEQIQAEYFKDAIKLIKEPTILAVGTSSFPGYDTGMFPMHHSLNPFLTFLERYCKDHKIALIVDEDKNLAEEIAKQRKGDRRYKNARVLVLAGEKTVKEDLKDIENIFSIGLDTTNITHCNYIRVMEMLRVLIELSKEKEITKEIIWQINKKHSKLGATLTDGIIIFVLPKEEPMDYDELKDTYKFQEFA